MHLTHSPSHSRRGISAGSHFPMCSSPCSFSSRDAINSLQNKYFFKQMKNVTFLIWNMEARGRWRTINRQPGSYDCSVFLFCLFFFFSIFISIPIFLFDCADCAWAHPVNRTTSYESSKLKLKSITINHKKPGIFLCGIVDSINFKLG